MKRKHIIRACLLLFCLLLCTACRSESKPKETRFSFVSEDSLTIVNAEGQELHFADKVWSGTMPVLDGHFTVDFVPGSTSVQVRFSESFSVRFEPERAKDRSICLSFDGDDFRAVEGPGLQNVEYTRSTVEATGENMQYEVGISTGTAKRDISPRRMPRLPSCSGTGTSRSRWIPWNSPQGRPARSAFATASRHLCARSGMPPRLSLTSFKRSSPPSLSLRGAAGAVAP